jgi:pseudouridine-5'-monophosphatase
MDGVLLDTEPLYTQAIQEVVAEFGKVYDWSVKVQVMGRDATEAARHMVAALGLPLGPEELLRRSVPILERLMEAAPEMAGAQALARRLRERGVGMAVATSGSTALTRLKTRRHAWFDLFGAVVCGDHPEVQRAKPAPDIFLAAARAIAAPPESCLVFEDSVAGVRAARAAGMQVIALPDPAVDPGLFGEAHQVVRGFAELSVDDLGLA